MENGKEQEFQTSIGMSNSEMEYKLSEISHKVFYEMENYSQLIIDLVEEVEELLDKTKKVDHVSFGAKNYDIHLILEIIDPLRVHDIKVLNELSEILEEKEIKYINAIKQLKNKN